MNDIDGLWIQVNKENSRRGPAVKEERMYRNNAIFTWFGRGYKGIGDNVEEEE